MNDYDRAKQITRGIMSELWMWLMALLVGAMVTSCIFAHWDVFIDDTDKDGWHRSGFQLLTDYGTGKQYLYKSGVIIPREVLNEKR